MAPTPLLTNDILSQTARLAEIAALISDPPRMKVVFALREGDWLWMDDLQKLCEVPYAMLHREIALLQDHGVIEVSKTPPHESFRLADGRALNLIELALRLSQE